MTNIILLYSIKFPFFLDRKMTLEYNNGCLRMEVRICVYFVIFILAINKW